jgi:hypothetical protein
MRSLILVALVACSAPAPNQNDDAGNPPQTDAGTPAPDAQADAPSTSSCVNGVPKTYTARSDRNVEVPGALPALGPAGSVIVDPAFGSRVLRVTDPSTLTKTNLSFFAVNEIAQTRWNADGSIFVIQSTDGARLPYTFDEKAFTAKRMSQSVTFGLGDFSHNDAHVAYGTKGHVIQKLDFSTMTYTDLVSVDAVIPGVGGYVQAVTAADDESLSMDFGGVQDTNQYVLVWNAITKTQHLLDLPKSQLDGVPSNIPLSGGISFQRIDRSGKYVAVWINRMPYVWDLAQKTIASYPHAIGTVGFDREIGGATGDDLQWSMDGLSTPNSASKLVTPPVTPTDKTNVSYGGGSWCNAQAQSAMPIVQDLFRDPATITSSAPWAPFQNEIVAVATDGSGTVWRFAHTWNFDVPNTKYGKDWQYYLGHVNVSQTGRHALFNSNWNKTLGADATTGDPRFDVFIVELPSACSI